MGCLCQWWGGLERFGAEGEAEGKDGVAQEAGIRMRRKI